MVSGELFVSGPADGKRFAIREGIDKVFVPMKIELNSLFPAGAPLYEPPQAVTYTRRPVCVSRYDHHVFVWAPENVTTSTALLILTENYAPSKDAKKSRPKYPHEKSDKER